MADIFQDEFQWQELDAMDSVVVACGDEAAATPEDFLAQIIRHHTKDENKNDDNENTEENEVDASETIVESETRVQSEPRIVTLEELANSDFIRNRQVAAKSIVDYLHQAGSNKEALHSVISIMCKLSEDEDIMVRSELMEHIPSIALFCKEHSEDLGIVIRQQIVPYTVKLLTDIQLQVRKIGHTTLLVLLEHNIIHNSQLSEWICPLIAQLSKSENTPEELQLEDVSVMCKMIPYVGKEITEKFFLEPFLSICCDPSSSARKVCLLHFGNLCKIMGRETTESILLPVFLDLCQDKLGNSQWVDIAIDLAGVVSPTTRNKVLSDLYISFLKNRSRQVWHTAYLSLGRYISTFADPSKTGLCYRDGIWIDIPFEDDSIEDQQNNDNYFETLTSQIISNPHFLDECSFRNLNNCFTNYNSDFGFFTDCSYIEFKQIIPQTSSKTALQERTNDENSNINSKLTYVKNSLNCEEKPTIHSRTLVAKDDHLCLHVDNENVFNNFQFWRTPLPEVELDTDIEECKSENINIKTKLKNEEGNSQNCASESNVRISTNQASVDTAILRDTDDKIIQIGENVASSFHWNKTVLDEHICLSEKRRRGFVVSPALFNIMTEKGKCQMTVYDQNIVPPELLMEFTNEVPVQEDMRMNIVYYFPSVAYTLGRKYWPCLRNIFNCLAKDLKFNIRKSVAASLHELAVILGHDITTEDLLPVFLDMFEDEKLRAIVLMHVAQFLRNLSPYNRRKFLPLIQQICMWEEDNNWRYRLLVAEQLIPCVELYTSCEALHFFPASLILLQDKVSAVRKSAVELLAVIMKSIAENSKSSEFLKAALCALDEKYRKANKWLWRQLYVYICQELAVKRSLPTEFYVDHIVPNLFSLAWDSVPNVRLAVARCLGLTLLPLEFLPSIQRAHYQLLLQIMYSLQSDVDKDVRHFAHLSAAAFNVLPPKTLSSA